MPDEESRVTSTCVGSSTVLVLPRGPFGLIAKLDRAEAKLNAVSDEMAEFVKADPYAIRGEVDEVNQAVILFFEKRLEIPVFDWSLALGEIVHHVRGTLDHLVCALVELQSRAPHSRHKFPIVKDDAAWRQAVHPPKDRRGRVQKGALDFIDPAHVALIKRLQPYKPTTGKPSLLTLQRFSNMDKHRLVHVAATWLTDAPSISVTATYPWPLRDVTHEPPGTVLGHHTNFATAFLAPSFPPNKQVNVHSDLKITTVFGEPGQEDVRVKDLRGCLTDVREIVGQFSSAF